MADFYEDDTPGVYDDTFYNSPGSLAQDVLRGPLPPMDPRDLQSVLRGPMPPMDPRQIQETLEPFTTADQLRLQKLDQGIAHVREQHDNGSIDDATAENLSQQITRQRQPLLMRQQQAKQQAQSEAQQTLIQQAAQMQGMQHSDALFRARGFDDRVVTRVGPNGELQEFYETSPNNWAQITSAQGTGGDGTDRNNAAQAHGYKPPEQPSTHTMTIEQGGRRQEVTYGQDPSSPSGYRMTGSRQTDMMGREILPQPRPSMAEFANAGAARYGVSPEQYMNAYQAADYAARHGVTPNEASKVFDSIIRRAHSENDRAGREAKAAKQAEQDLTSPAGNRVFQGELKNLRDEETGGKALVGGGKVFVDANGNEFAATDKTTWNDIAKVAPDALEQEAERRARAKIPRRRGGEETPSGSTVPRGTPEQPAREEPKAETFTAQEGNELDRLKKKKRQFVADRESQQRPQLGPDPGLYIPMN